MPARTAILFENSSEFSHFSLYVGSIPDVFAPVYQGREDTRFMGRMMVQHDLNASVYVWRLPVDSAVQRSVVTCVEICVQERQVTPFPLIM
jgi:hypothetical protein